MYTRKFKFSNQKLDSIFHQCHYLYRSRRRDFLHSHSRFYSKDYISKGHQGHDNPHRKFQSKTILSRGIAVGNDHFRFCERYAPHWACRTARFYSAEGDGRSASEDKVPVKDTANFDKGRTRREKVLADVRRCDEHARLGEHDQQEWLNNEKLSFESKTRESPFLSKRERFKNEFLRRVVPWEKITVSWETFPYYIHEHTKNLLVECAASHLKHNKFAASYGARLTSSSGRILLHSVPGTELYRERLVRALARDLQVPLLVLDSNVLAPHDFGQECTSESETEEDNAESGEECTSESDVEDENDASNEEDWASSSEVKSDCSDEDENDLQASAEVLKKLVPHDFEKRVSGEPEVTPTSVKQDNVDSSQQSKRSFKKGDRVKYIGASAKNDVVDNRIILGKIPTSDGPINAFTFISGRPLSSGQRGEVYEVNGEQVAVILESNDGKASIYWIDVQDIEHDLDTQAEDWYIAMEALCEVKC